MKKLIVNYLFVMASLGAMTTLYSCSDKDEPKPEPENPDTETIIPEQKNLSKAEFDEKVKGKLWVRQMDGKSVECFLVMESHAIPLTLA
ncbi:MAG: hypothetical protein NC217_07625 [Muribaculaceae bacterium]|nr:hypothetical protein [Muribaculaceae bacterium]